MRLSLCVYFISAICLLSVKNAHGSASCPSEANHLGSKKPFGSRRNDRRCEIFNKIDWNDYKGYNERGYGYIHYFQNVHCQKFKGGYPEVCESLNMPNGIDNSWIKNVNWNYVFHGIFITAYEMGGKWHSARYGPYRYYKVTTVKSIPGDKEKETEYLMYVEWLHWWRIRYFDSFPKEFNWARSELYKTEEMQSAFGGGRFANPKLVTSKFKSGSGQKTVAWYTAESYYNDRSDLQVKCTTSLYFDCVEEIRHGCIFYEKEKKWLDKELIITQWNERPYGKPCSNRTLSEIGAKECNATCKGTWSEWATNKPIPCGVYTMHRIQGIKAAEACKEGEEKHCCHGTKTIHAQVPCEDFAYNTTINLRTEGCKNKRPLITGMFGHLACDCGEQYTGTQCEKDLCSNRCLNGGTCIPYGNGSLCICQLGFEGDNCEKKSTSCGKIGVCENGGTCIPTSDTSGAYCKCVSGFGGVSCESKASFCESASCNHRGACYNITETLSFKCNCHYGFTGERCEGSIAKVLDSMDAVSGFSTVTISVLLIFAVFTFMTGGVVVHRRRRRRRRMGGRNSSMSSTYSVFSTYGSKGGYSTAATAKPKVVAAKEKGAAALAKGGSAAVGLSMKASTGTKKK